MQDLLTNLSRQDLDRSGIDAVAGPHAVGVLGGLADLEADRRRLRRLAAGAPLRLTELVRVTSLPDWAMESPRLAWLGVAHAPEPDVLLARLAAAGLAARIVARTPVPPGFVAPAIAGQCFESGVSVGCCGALANDEVIGRVAADLAGRLHWLHLALTAGRD